MRTPENKMARQAAIKKIIESNQIKSQSQLLFELAKLKLKITQATLSRDLDELGIVKNSQADGSCYVLKESVADPDLKAIASSLIVGIDHSGNIVVVRTPPGGAQFFASSVDRAADSEIIGTIAGDDTVLLVTKNPGGSQQVVDKLWELARSNR
jgi:transcriptional regulator of arginine metabolism